MKKTQLTQSGFDKLTDDLKELKEIKEPEAIRRLEDARRKGDLSENSEYDAAKEARALVHGRIRELETILDNAEIVQDHNKSGIHIGSTVVAEKNGNEESFAIVGEFESDPLNGKLSATSPIGKGLLGKTIGDEVEIEVPAGTLKFKIIKHT